MRHRCTLAAVTSLAISTAALAAPVVRNHSFEADRFTKSPGQIHRNGPITAWETVGNAGLNPTWRDPDKPAGPTSAFHDNGAIPHGRQIALIQGPGKLIQNVAGFEAGKRYRVHYRENARVQRQGTIWPKVRVTLNGETIVSAHELTPVARGREFRTPFCRVESGIFTAPADGACELIIETVQESATTTLLVDDVRIVEVTD